MVETVIVDGLRTPFGKLGGGLSSVPASDLAASLIAELLKRNNVDPATVDEVILGHVIQAGCGQIPSRQALLKAGMPNTCESTTVNKVCASGMRAVTLGDLRIRANDGEIILAGGMESMSQAPYFVEANSARFGKRMGHVAFKDAMIHDGLECPVAGVHMAIHGANVAEEFKITREDQDAWALRSHLKSLDAISKGRFAEEILPYTVTKGKKVETISTDEGPRADTNIETLTKLKPVFDPKGTVTAGNAPGINDGACVLLI
ncbi:MAG: acetyl-CoA C-acyltransferase, partial [Leptolyngbya sp.]|nr:acetyl-CoA C-acyltransferase [Candidatus Melainabacteria bacterium]